MLMFHTQCFVLHIEHSSVRLHIYSIYIYIYIYLGVAGAGDWDGAEAGVPDQQGRGPRELHRLPTHQVDS